ncbi:MAG TPA: hypothetical protein VLH15_07505 [Dehalococcoidales bacterium]|nr:hypothetical protein [Dehalococcoidales bacterium]
MSTNTAPYLLDNTSLTPRAGFCFDYETNNFRQKKSIWLVPHVIRHRADCRIITWRCNWGNSCESECLYAMVKDKSPEE